MISDCSHYFLRITASLLFAFVSTLLLTQPNSDVEIKGKVVSSETGEAVPYASIINIDNNRFGTTTNDQGLYRLKLGDVDLDDLIHFTSLGYRDTTIALRHLMGEKIVVKLIPTVYQLPDFELASERRSEGRIGDESGRFITENEGISVTTPGLAYAAWVKAPKKAQNTIIESIKIFLSDQFFDSPFTVRILSPKDDLVIKRKVMYPISSFDDLLTETKLFRPEKAGWYEINLGEYEVPFPDKGVFIVISQVDEGERYFWRGGSMITFVASEGDDEQRYGHMVGVQKRSSKSRIFDAIYSGNRLAVVERDNFHGALVVYYTHQ